MTTVKRCPQCNTIILRAGKCPTCDANKREESIGVVVHKCHFLGDNKCRGKVNIRVNDSWLCNWHYDNFYDHRLRQNEVIPKQELRFKSHLDTIKEEVERIRKKTGCTVREACISILKSHGLYSALPDNLKRETDHEALEERRAIQEEA